mmetsp:Transcript_25299/g.64908  ORF Transcript_25299/g.64908 Transcript_25299/m.64908 type:complete len:296 (+) Transcript_25299:573-1460(+)
MPADLVGSRTLSDCDVRAMNAAFLVEQLTVAQSGRAYSLRHLREITGLPVTRLGVSSSNRRCTAPDGDAAILHGLDAAWNAGLRFFDPQRRHFRGTAEHLFGMGLHDRGGQSGSYTVLSRLGTMAPPPGSDRDGTADLKPENLLLQWHANLHRLGSRAAKAAVLEADARLHVNQDGGETHLTAELHDSLQRLRTMKEQRVGKPDEILAVGGASLSPGDDAYWLRVLLSEGVDFVVLSGPLAVFNGEVVSLLQHAPVCSVIMGSPFPGDVLMSLGDSGAEEPLAYCEVAAVKVSGV